MFGVLQSLTRTKDVSSPSGGSNNLSRCLTTWDLVSLSIGATLGAGIYVVTGQVAASIAGPAVILSFTIAACASVLSGLCYAEFGARVPRTTGSAYTYSYVTVGEFTAFVIGWNLILEYMIGTAADARALSGCFDYIVGHVIRNFTLTHIGTFHIPALGDTYPDILSCLLTLAITGVLASGVKRSSVISTVCNIVNLAVIGFIIIAGAFYVRRENWSQRSGFFPFGASGVLGGAATCFYAFVGFDVIATTGQETKTPQRSIPLAIMISLFIVSVCYFSVSSILTLILPYYQLDKLSPIPNAFAQRGFHAATYIIGVGAVCGLISSLLGSLFPLPRIIYAMANDGLLFESFKKINAKTEVPLLATVYPGIMTSVLALVFNLNDLVEMMSIGTLLAYTLVSMCVLILRYQPEPSAELLSNESSFDLGDLTLTEEHRQLLKESDNLAVKEEHSFSKDLKESSDDSSVKEEHSFSKDLKESDDSPVKQRSKRTVLDKLDGTVKHIVSQCPTEKTGRIVSWMSLVLFVSVFFFFSFMIHGLHLILDKNIPVVILTLIFGFLCLFCIGVIMAMPQNTTRLSFKVPFVPAIPILAVFINVFLMLKLSRTTWIRFGIWMAIGLSIYFLYGLRHSLVGLKMKIKSRVDLTQHPCVLAKDFHEFEYNMDVIPAHRDLSRGKQSPISPIFWTSLQKYHFFCEDDNEREESNWKE